MISGVVLSVTKFSTAIRPRMGRFYATDDTAESIVSNNRVPLEASESAVLGLWEAGLVVPSLTTTIGLGRGLVMRNNAIQGQDKAQQVMYLEQIKELQRYEQENVPSESLKSAMQIGTAVHLIAELRNQTLLEEPEQAQDSAFWRSLEAEALREEGRRIPWRSLSGFYRYSTALRQYFEENPEILSPEVRVMQDSWCGTADGIGGDVLVDYKTGRRLSLIANFVQIITLAEATGKSEAVLVWLRQNGTYKSVTIEKGTPIWNSALGAFKACLNATEGVLRTKLSETEPQYYLLSEEPHAETGEPVLLSPQEVATVLANGNTFLAQERQAYSEFKPRAMQGAERVSEAPSEAKGSAKGGEGPTTSSWSEFLP